jgi:hypothetical protein
MRHLGNPNRRTIFRRTCSTPLIATKEWQIGLISPYLFEELRAVLLRGLLYRGLDLDPTP